MTAGSEPTVEVGTFTVAPTVLGIADGTGTRDPLFGSVEFRPRQAAVPDDDGITYTGPVVVPLDAGGRIPTGTRLPAWPGSTCQVILHVRRGERARDLRIVPFDIPAEPGSTVALSDYIGFYTDPSAGTVYVRGPRGSFSDDDRALFEAARDETVEAAAQAAESVAGATQAAQDATTAARALDGVREVVESARDSATGSAADADASAESAARSASDAASSASYAGVSAGEAEQSALASSTAASQAASAAGDVSAIAEAVSSDADRARSSAESADESATLAGTHAGVASGQAGAAASSADRAAAEAQAAADSAGDLDDAVEAAEASRDAAAGSASSAASSASAAAESESAASASASAASSDAVSAAESAGAASTSAGEAASSAQSAEDSAADAEAAGGHAQSASSSASAAAQSADAAAGSASAAEESAGRAAAEHTALTDAIASGEYRGVGVESIRDEDGDGTATVLYTDGGVDFLPLPPGPAPSVEWDGPRLNVGGVVSPDLTGPVSQVPGPPGAVPTAADYFIVGPGRPDVPATTGGLVSSSTPVGATYTSTDGAGVGAHVWLKTGGGWIVTHGYMRRNVTSLLPADYTGSVSLYLTRDNRRVTWSISGSVVQTTVPPPSGYEAPSTVGQGVLLGAGTFRGTIQRAANGGIYFRSNTETHGTMGDFTYDTTASWPSTAPGTPG